MVEDGLIEELRRFSTPSILNALKRLGRRPEQLESVDRRIVRCMSPELGVRVGFAVTRKVATRRSGAAAGPSPTGRIDQGLLDVREPRFLVVENVGDWRGPVCIWGELGAHINLALGCDAGVTNGPVRDIDEMAAAGFQTFANGAGTGGGHVDVLEVGAEVAVGGVVVRPGDLIHGDRHGVIRVPLELAGQLPEALRQEAEYERRIIAACRSPNFSLDALEEALKREH